MWTLCNHLAEALAWPIAVFLCCLPFYYILRYRWESIKLPNTNKRAVFISGCDTGFGRLLAIKCAKNGIPCYAGCLTKQGEKSLAEETKHCQYPLVVLPLDVSNDQSVDKAAKMVQDHLAQGDNELFAVVNNAGIFSIHGPDAWTKIQHYQKSIEVNLYGVIRCTHAFLHLLKKSKGRVISTSSVSGRISVPFAGPYTVAKYGVEAYMDTIRLELAQYGMTCCLLEPGIFRTNLLNDKAMDKRVHDVWNGLTPELQEEYGEQYKKNFNQNWNLYLLGNASNNLSWVVDAYFHAITARFPRARYRCGWDSLFFFIPLTYFPTFICDFLIGMMARKGVLPAILQHKKSK